MRATIRILVVAVLAAVAGAQEVPRSIPHGSEQTADLGPQQMRQLHDTVDEALVRIRVGREFQAAESMLNGVWLQAVSVKPFEGQRELLVDVALARSELFEAQGQVELAGEATRYLLLNANAPRWKTRMERLVPASAELIALTNKTSMHPRLEARRRELFERSRKADAGDQESLETILRDHIETRNFKFVTEIGARAVPVLADVVLERPNEFPTVVHEDPLFFLVMLGERQAAELILRNIDAGGYAWHQRIIRAMELHDVLAMDEKWGDRPRAGAPRPCLVPEWPEILARFLATPDSAREAMKLVSQTIEADGVTAEMAQALNAALDSGQPDLKHDALSVLKYQGRKQSMFPVLEHAVAGDDPFVRRFAADKLLAYRTSEALRKRVDDPEPAVRTKLATLLGRHTIPNYNMWPAVTDAEGRALLLRLAEDEDVEVRRAAAESIVDLAEPLGDDVYFRLLDDPDAGVRMELVILDHPRPEFLSRVLDRLAADTDEEVLEALDERLRDNEKWHEHSTALRAAATRRLLERVRPMSQDGYDRVIRHLAGSDQGFRTLIEAALREEDGAILKRTLDFQSSIRTSFGHGSTGFLALDDATLADTLPALYRANEQSYYNVRNAIERAYPPRWAAMRRLLAREDAPIHVRLGAAKIASKGGGEEFRRQLLDLLADPLWRTRPPSETDRELLGMIGDALPSPDVNPLCLELARRRDVLDELCLTLMVEYRPSQPLGRDISLAVLDRWFSADGRTFIAVRKALFHLRSLPDHVDPKLLKSAARTEGYAETAVETMGALRSPEYLSILGECLNANWIYEPTSRRNVQFAAARALEGYLSDEAADLLLAGLGMASEDSVRDVCRQALENIRRYENEKRLWQEHKEGRLERDDAIVSLLALLADDDATIRAEAAKGLGTLGAVEYIPRLIEMLRDENDDVKSAARQALARLNETTGKKD